ncbi:MULTISPECIES: DUF523 domain-containing protein [Bacillus]|uniref:DUF523 domain-containing protein n=1 Tax=Bacillus TaxID=1386 RepID=UPI0002BD98CF|nr:MULTISPECIES: DUF523 domain-containing protein [Bacillus]EMI14091.1 pxo2-47 [Bacillus stratosphericus LAMA 585]KOA78626.1 hypothetical protein ACR53_10020 [Bacillus stratosphericus]UUH74582.1 DUF523 domain-containing protein [Bacillus altitudinis]SFX35359.1 Uncharacterized conserved protein YbbK, DUF523 family [Bacillus altitudinis]SNR87467.1 Uncharacterized conserved protein YbbK, DUF523 family [Bacillus altitudinis]
MIVVSACLAGLKVRYNGSHRLDQRIEELVQEGKAVTVCPELLGGFSTPRPPAEIIGGDGHDVLRGQAAVVDVHGTDVTEMYVNGAQATLKQVQTLGATSVVLKEYSPSCGSRMIYRGEFNGKTKAGDGVTSALLKQHGIQVFSEEDDWTSLFV